MQKLLHVALKLLLFPKEIYDKVTLLLLECRSCLKCFSAVVYLYVYIQILYSVLIIHMQVVTFVRGITLYGVRLRKEGRDSL